MWVMSLICESCLVYVSHVSYMWVMSRICESCLVYVSHVAPTTKTSDARSTTLLAIPHTTLLDLLTLERYVCTCALTITTSDTRCIHLHIDIALYYFLPLPQTTVLTLPHTTVLPLPRTALLILPHTALLSLPHTVRHFQEDHRRDSGQVWGPLHFLRVLLILLTNFTTQYAIFKKITDVTVGKYEDRYICKATFPDIHQFLKVITHFTYLLYHPRHYLRPFYL
jgi:hypothetical protein